MELNKLIWFEREEGKESQNRGALYVPRMRKSLNQGKTHWIIIREASFHMSKSLHIQSIKPKHMVRDKLVQKFLSTANGVFNETTDAFTTIWFNERAWTRSRESDMKDLGDQEQSNPRPENYRSMINVVEALHRANYEAITTRRKYDRVNIMLFVSQTPNGDVFAVQNDYTEVLRKTLDCEVDTTWVVLNQRMLMGSFPEGQINICYVETEEYDTELDMILEKLGTRKTFTLANHLSVPCNSLTPLPVRPEGVDEVVTSAAVVTVAETFENMRNGHYQWSIQAEAVLEALQMSAIPACFRHPNLPAECYFLYEKLKLAIRAKWNVRTQPPPLRRQTNRPNNTFVNTNDYDDNYDAATDVLELART